MKTFILLSVMFATATLMASEKVIELKVHVTKMVLQPDKMYRLEFRELAAVYSAPEKFQKCLQKSIRENKVAAIEVSAHSLVVQKCSVK